MADSEQSRRASAARSGGDRAGATVVEDINRLAAPSQQRDPLPILEPVGALPPQRGRAYYVPPAKTGGGIASPLIETDVSMREYWPNGYESSDGLFVLPAVKKLVMIDAAEAEVIFKYADPEIPEEPTP